MIRIFREYRLKFYLNARHFIIIGGKSGVTHPHTWEFALNIRIGRGDFAQFSDFERVINKILSPYQDQTLNLIPPFDSILPTLENMADYLADQFYEEIYRVGGDLTRMEASETPSRSYILRLAPRHQQEEQIAEDKRLDEVIDAILDDLEGQAPVL